MNKKDRRKRQIAGMIRGNQDSCARKLVYEHIDDAWEMSELHFIKLGTYSIPYKCIVCRKYHLTSKTHLGDLTHVPEHLRELFSTKDQELEDSFFTKLRRFIGVSR